MKTKLLLALIFSGLFSTSVALGGGCPSFLKVGESYKFGTGMSEITFKIVELDANTVGCWARVESKDSDATGAWFNISQGVYLQPDIGRRKSSREGE